MTAATESTPRESERLLPPLAGFVAAVLMGWVALSAAAWNFSRSQHLAGSLAWPLTLAFLTEYSFYLLPGFARLRAYMAARFGRLQIAAAIALSTLIPYTICATATGGLTLSKLAVYSAIMGATAFWFAIPMSGGPLARLRDFSFLAFLGAVILSGVLRWIYPAPAPKLPLEVLGHVTLIRSAVLATLLLRRPEHTDFGFIPRGKDVLIGLVWFGVCALLAVPLAGSLGELTMVRNAPNVWRSLGAALGIFWVVALSEEFFFRALLQQWLASWTNSRAAGLVTASLLFGACHLVYGHPFPNWRFATLATMLGFCCGAAFLQSGSMRASMVTHALAASTFRLLLVWKAF